MIWNYYPEFVGKSGVVSKRNLVGRFSAYPFTAKIVIWDYGESLLYKNNFSVRSDDELEVGMEIEIIEHEKRTVYILDKESSNLFGKVIRKNYY